MGEQGSFTTTLGAKHLACGPCRQFSPLIAEFRALGTYPPEALAPHAEMLERALDAALASPIREIVSNTQQFLVSRLGEEWANRAARKYLKFYSLQYDRWGNPLATFFMHVNLGARGGSRPAQELLGYFVQLSRDEPECFRFHSGPDETAQAQLKRIEAAGWAPPRQ